MKIDPISLDGVSVIRPSPFVDERGLFARFFCEEELSEILGERRICQINFSSNLQKGTVRGLHFQTPPYTDMKFVRCIRGQTFHAIVDLRESSPTHLQWESFTLSEESMAMLCIPEGFAHGFQSLEHHCGVMYFVTNRYSAEHQGGVRYDDPTLNIRWPLEVTELSERDGALAYWDSGKKGQAA